MARSSLEPLAALREHWPEYLIEGWALGSFMLSASIFTVLLESPFLPFRALVPDPFARRAIVGVAMGLTAVGLIYSRWGRRSGAHMNPAVTLSFVRLGLVRPSGAEGPGIEFLDYRTPPSGRPAPVDTQSDDVVHVHLALLVPDLEQQVRMLEENHVRFVSPGIVAPADGSHAAMVRDPDGHALLLEDRPSGL